MKEYAMDGGKEVPEYTDTFRESLHPYVCDSVDKAMEILARQGSNGTLPQSL